MLKVKRNLNGFLIGLFLFGTILALATCQRAKSIQPQLNLALPDDIHGFDPINSADLYTNYAIHEIYEPLLQYAYLKRPLELEPCLTEGMPKISKDGRIYDIKLKRGIYFTDDVAFKLPPGKKRELIASDVVFSLKRLADPKLNSNGWWLLDNRVVGLNAFREQNAKRSKTDYSLPVAGLQATDAHSLRIQLLKPYPQLLYALAMPYTGVVAPEVVEHYGQEFLNHPVGTGPYRLTRFQRGFEITLEKNQDYRPEFFIFPDSPTPVQLPILDKLVLRIQREAQPRWLNFLQGNLDWSEVPKDNYDSAIDAKGELREEFAKKGIKLWKGPDLDLTFSGFNMRHPLLGKNLHLRRAMSLAVDPQKRIERLYNGRAIAAEGPIPPGLAGYDASYKNPYRGPDLAKAKKELALAGFPGGTGLTTIIMESIANSSQRHFDELFISEMQAIGVKVKINTNTWPEFLDKIHKGQAAMFGMAWGADYPDAENFLGLYYSKNAAPGSNMTSYSNPEYDALYEKISVMPESKERTELYKKMARIVAEDVPMIFGVHRLRFVLYYDWLKNYQPHPMRHGFIKYYKKG